MADTKTIKTTQATTSEPINWSTWMKKTKVDYAIYPNEKTYTSQISPKTNTKLSKLKERILANVKYLYLLYEIVFLVISTGI